MPKPKKKPKSIQTFRNGKIRAGEVPIGDTGAGAGASGY